MSEQREAPAGGPVDRGVLERRVEEEVAEALLSFDGYHFDGDDEAKWLWALETARLALAALSVPDLEALIEQKKGGAPDVG